MTNAVRYGGPPISLRVACTGDDIRISVRDASSAEPTLTDAADLDIHGRGVALIDLISDDWGVEQHPDDGKDVWFTLTTP